MKTLINNSTQQLKDIQNGSIWIGENFEKKLANIDANIVFLRPIPNTHSVAEIISHLTVWKRETILKIKTRKGSITDDLEDNWFSNKTLQKKGWKTIINEFQNSQQELIALLNTKTDSFLDEIYFDTDFKRNCTYKFVIDGMLHHDIYHLGQLGIIIKLTQKNNK